MIDWLGFYGTFSTNKLYVYIVPLINIRGPGPLHAMLGRQYADRLATTGDAVVDSCAHNLLLAHEMDMNMDWKRDESDTSYSDRSSSSTTRPLPAVAVTPSGVKSANPESLSHGRKIAGPSAPRTDSPSRPRRRGRHDNWRQTWGYWAQIITIMILSFL